MQRILTLTIALTATIVFAACTEIDQDAPKPFAGKDETRSYAGPPFDGNKELHEKALRERAETQDDYLRIPAQDPQSQ